MYKPLSLFIGLRYTRSKKRNHFVSFISLLSVLGIALGVLVLITVLSVMNGFDQQIREKVFSMVPTMTVSHLSGKMSSWSSLLATAQKLDGVQSASPVISGEGLLQSDFNNTPIYVTGILPSYGHDVIALDDKLIAGHLSQLTKGSFGIVIGQGIAYRLSVNVGDKVMLITPQLNVSPLGVVPQLKRFTVVGIFHASGGFGYDDSLAFINLMDAGALYKLGDAITDIQIKLVDPYQVPLVESALEKHVAHSYLINDWTTQYGNFFQAIKMEKNMMFFILMLIIAVAVFNLVSMLVMVVNEKQADIAILKTFGASTRTVMTIFIIQGFVLGLLGTLFGVVGGVLLSLNVTRLVDFLQTIFHTQFVSSDVYFVDYLPSHLLWSDVWHIAFLSILLSLFATIYPAWRGSKVHPARALRYE
jgi:lipoprotein-releasing system permease protein